MDKESVLNDLYTLFDKHTENTIYNYVPLKHGYLKRYYGYKVFHIIVNEIRLYGVFIECDYFDKYSGIFCTIS